MAQDLGARAVRLRDRGDRELRRLVAIDRRWIRGLPIVRLEGVRELQVGREVPRRHHERHVDARRRSARLRAGEHDYFEHDGDAYIVVELLAHGSLRRHVGRLGLAQIAACSRASSRP
jgi:hypothetical protein